MAPSATIILFSVQWGGEVGGGGKRGEDGGMRGGLGIGGGVTSPPSPNSPDGDHMCGNGPKISTGTHNS